MQRVSFVSAIVFALFVSTYSPNVFAQRPRPPVVAEGVIAGAIWTFELKPQNPGKRKSVAIRGRYRVEDFKIYQAEEAGGEMTKEIGSSKPGPKKEFAIVEVKSLRGKNASGEWVEGINGTAKLKSLAFGECEGLFVDSEGFHWDMKCKRVRE